VRLRTKRTKVFWFFFSKKNILSYGLAELAEKAARALSGTPSVSTRLATTARTIAAQTDVKKTFTSSPLPFPCRNLPQSLARVTFGDPRRGP
jgi:hypothetical protein